MRIFFGTLDRYLFGLHLVYLGMTFLVTSLLFGVVITAALVGMNVPFIPALLAFFISYPNMVTFLAPVASGVSVVILFGGLNQTGELDAVKSNGISLFRFLRPVLLCQVALAAICWFLAWEIAPDSYFKRNQTLARIALTHPLDFLREGRFNETVLGCKIYIASREGNRVKDLILIENPDEPNGRIVRASFGTVEVLPNGEGLSILLEDAEIQFPNPEHPDDVFQAIRVSAEEYHVNIAIPGTHHFFLDRKISNHRAPELFRQLDLELAKNEDGLQRATKIKVELSQRAALGTACIGFAMMGIPLGMMSERRRHRIIGPFIMLGVIFIEYLLISFAETMYRIPASMPHYWLWLPVIAAVFLGGYLVQKKS